MKQEHCDKIEKALGITLDKSDRGFYTRPSGTIVVELGGMDITYEDLAKLSRALKTKNINLNYEEGYSYSEYTYDSGSLTLFIRDVGSLEA